MAPQHRNAYLSAMGIEVWQQRVPLPGAPGFAVAAAVAPDVTGAAEAQGPVGADATTVPSGAVVGSATAAPDLCVLFELTDAVEPTQDARRLLTDLVIALGGDGRNISFAARQFQAIHDTPATESADEVDDRVAAPLAGLVADEVRRVVVLGEVLKGLAHWRGAVSDYRMCTTHALDELLAEPLLKRELWRDVQSLLAGDSEDG